MFSSHIYKRVAVSKAVGLGLGLCYAVAFAGLGDAGWRLSLGLILWAVILGALVGLAEPLSRIPGLALTLPAWLRGAWIGIWMGLLLIVLAYDPLKESIARMPWLGDIFHAPWWALIDAAVVGLLTDLIATRMAGPPDR